MDRAPLPLVFRINGETVSGETLVLDGGPYIVVLTTTLATLDLRLHASYLAHPASERILVSELAAKGEAPALAQRTLLDLPGTLVYERSALLIDHLARLVELARVADIELEVDEPSLDRATRELVACA